MSTNEIAALDAAGQRAESAFQALQDHESSWGHDLDTIPAGQRERRQRLQTALGNASRELEDVATRAEKIEALREAAKDPRNRESGDVTNQWAPGRDPGMRFKSDPWASGSGDILTRVDSPQGLATRARDAAEFAPGLTDHARNLLSEVVENDQHPDSSAFVLAATDPNYRRAFEKVLPNPQHGHLLWTEAEREAFARVEASRAQMSLTSANGGYLVPFQLDPSIILTGAGVSDPFRELATVVTTVGPTYHGVQSAGATAEWLGEGATAADGNPTFSQLSIPVAKASAFLSASYEIFQDSDIGVQIPQLIADAKATLENAAFSTGSGSGAPKGIVTAVSVTGSTVTATTRGAFTAASEGDLFALVEALPPRARQGQSPAIVGNIVTINTLRKMETAGGASTWTTLGDGTPNTVLGMKLREASGMTSATTSGSTVLVAGDFAKYFIVDRIGTTVVPIPALLDTSTGRPTCSHGWHAFWRVGADVADAGAFRRLLC